MKKAASLHIILRGTNRNCLQEFDCFVRSRLTVAQAYGLFQTPDTSYHHEEDVGWMAPLEEPGPGCSSPGTDRRHQVDIGTVLRGTDWLRSQYPAPCPISSPGGQGHPGVSSPGTPRCVLPRDTQVCPPLEGQTLARGWAGHCTGYCLDWTVQCSAMMCCLVQCCLAQ